MPRRRLFILATTIFTSLAGSIHADIPRVSLSLDVNVVRRGGFLLSDASMPFLLSIGYNLVTITNHSNAMNIPVLKNELDEEVYFLQKGRSLYRCQEENSIAYGITCWRLDPVQIDLAGTLQRMPEANMLLGKWQGAFLNSNQNDALQRDAPMVPATVTFDDNSVTITGINGGKPMKAVYDWNDHGGAAITLFNSERQDALTVQVSFKQPNNRPNNITIETRTSQQPGPTFFLHRDGVAASTD